MNKNNCKETKEKYENEQRTHTYTHNKINLKDSNEKWFLKKIHTWKIKAEGGEKRKTTDM